MGAAGTLWRGSEKSSEAMIWESASALEVKKNWEGSQDLFLFWERYCHDYLVLSYRARDLATHHVAWAVPCAEAIMALVRYSPVVEIGAGTGYWAGLAARAGANILAFDRDPPVAGAKSQCWLEETGTFFPVRVGGPEMAARHPERALFICWPEYDSPMAANCLKNYQGSWLIYIGEPGGGCTADDKFQEALERDWRVLEEVAIPQWPGIHDRMLVLKRAGRAKKRKELT